MTSLHDRLTWVMLKHKDLDQGLLLEAIIREIESTHRIIDPELVTEDMLDACFSALPEHYDPPDPKRRLWHAFKAKRRYTSMAKAAPKIIV